MNRLLIVDDSLTNRVLLESLFSRVGYEVDLAADGLQALNIARVSKPDLVISDVLMPVMDGFTLCREWQRDSDLQPIPFLFYSATYTDEADLALGRSLGARDYLPKPIDPKIIIETVARLIREGVPNPTPVPQLEETVYLQGYNQVLIHKLEDKMAQLEATNRLLEAEVSERRAKEAKLVERNRLLELASDAIFSLAIDGRITFWNQSATRLFGWTEAQALGHLWTDLFGDYPPQVAHLFHHPTV
ncbi:MAG: response regulator, partial [Fimbriiglobus sp.]